MPFIPAENEWKYEVIKNVANQFEIVKGLLQREDVEVIYNAGDSGREGEYIQRLVFMMAKPNAKAKILRVWIDSQTEDEIRRGINEAKPESEYDNLSDSAYLRAKEDYLIGINFSRLLSILFGRNLAKKLEQDKASISVGRVMTCVLGMVVSREREIRDFKKIPYYKIIGKFATKEQFMIDAEWRVSETSSMLDSPKLYNESGFKTMITEWQKYTTDTINPYKTSYFNFSNSQTIRLVYIALARFLHIDCREINVKPMAFYRYLSLHSNLGSEVTIKTGLCRARKWLQENDIHRK